ncbi:MAG: hypothetical protein VW866_00945 [Hyphomicrobiales bacterium]
MTYKHARLHTRLVVSIARLCAAKTMPAATAREAGVNQGCRL